MLKIFLYVLLTLIYVNLLEYLVHFLVLHKLGSKKSSVFSFHWHRHHRKCRQSQFEDSDYTERVKWHTTGKEIAGLGLLALVHLPVLWLSATVYGTLIAYAVSYYVIHAKSHKDPFWARKWVPWHYDHHMGRSQQRNFNVVFPLWDYILGTRVKYMYDQDGRPKKC